MKFGKFIMNGEYASVEKRTPFPTEEAKLNRRTTRLYDNGGLVSFRKKFTVADNIKKWR